MLTCVMLPSMLKPHTFKFSIRQSWSKSMKSSQLNIFEENKIHEHIWKYLIYWILRFLIWALPGKVWFQKGFKDVAAGIETRSVFSAFFEKH